MTAQPSKPAKASAIERSYRLRTPRSAECQARAERVLPGGHSRLSIHYLPYTLTIDRGEGSCLWDVDGNRYIDLSYNFTALVHGHAYPPVRKAVQEQLGRGTAWTANNPHQAELAEQLCERIPGVELVRFTNSGSEAAALALLLARTITRRRKLLMARYGYYGFLPEFQSGSFNRQESDTLLADFNDADSFRQVLEERGSEIAAVFLEPVTEGDLTAAAPAFLQAVRQAAAKAGALLVFNEIMTFRLGMGGCQGEWGIRPDLTLLGKLIGGGFPAGAVGGLREHLKILAPDALKALHMGTFSDNPISMTAGSAAVRELSGRRIEEMARLGRRLKQGLEQAAARQGVPLTVRQEGSLLNLYFSPSIPASHLQRKDRPLVRAFHLAALNRGLFFEHTGLITLSTVMTEKTIDEVVQRAEDALADAAAEIDGAPG